MAYVLICLLFSLYLDKIFFLKKSEEEVNSLILHVIFIANILFLAWLTTSETIDTMTSSGFSFLK